MNGNTEITLVAFSETWISNYSPKFLNYNAEWKNRVGLGGGIRFLIRKGVQYQKVPSVAYVGGYLEYQTFSVKFGNNKSINILNIYNPGKSIHKNEIKHYIEQLGKRYILVGDFNAHSKLLSSRCVRPNATGMSLEALLIESNACLINPVDFYTYICPHTGKRSCLDPCLSSANIAPLIETSRLLDVGSDYYPISIILEMEPVIIDKMYPKKWKINENVQKFTSALSKSISNLTQPSNINNVADNFTSKIYDAASCTIERSSGKGNNRKQVCWWTQECSAAVAARRLAKRLLEKYPSRENILLYQQKTAKVKKICLDSKRKSFHNYIESLTYDTPTATVWKKINSLKEFAFEDMMIEMNGDLITSSLDKANIFAQHLKNISKSGEHVDLVEFNKKLHESRNEGINEEYNEDISIEELAEAIVRGKNTSPGLDSITNTLRAYLIIY